jgi:hypothetical protein
MALFYCEQARQARMNENAIVKWDASLAKKATKKREIVRVVG